MPPDICDLLGRPIEVGDTIAYPGRRGSTVYQNVGVVREVNQFGPKLRIERKATSDFNDGTGRLVTVSEIHRVVVLDKAIGPAATEFDANSVLRI